MTRRRTGKWVSGSALAALCIGLAGAAQGASLAVENGAITAVRGIEIQGQRYDLTFADGSFNALYPAEHGGYGSLARDAANALLAASERGALQADPKWQKGLKPLGCTASESCTILLPDHSDGAAPSAETTYAVEIIFAQGRFRSVTVELWPFHAAADTQYMPDMMYAILSPGR